MLWFSGQDGDVNVEKDPGLKEDLESGKAGSCFFPTWDALRELSSQGQQ